MLLLTNSTSLLAQISAIVLNDETKAPIHYANIGVEDEQTGTFTNEDGKFILNNISPKKRLFFSAVGYEKLEKTAHDISDTIYLKPQAIELSEVRIIKKQNLLNFKTGKLKGNLASILTFYPNPKYRAQLIAKYFPPKKEYIQTPFLKKVKIRTHLYRDDFSINLVFYSVGETGEPKNYLYDKNIVCKIEKGYDRIQTIDVSELNITVPADGFFVSLETLPYQNKNKEELNGLGYILIKAKKNTDTWLNETNGNWTKNKKFNIPMELELSN
ncbi:MAG: carboxypeptidase-like regulatory domain-containing protein [Flavobacterium sp.]